VPRRIPPFAALRAFEAAARHCNLRVAGEELFLSVSAVSHQIKALEQFLGVQLFSRVHNSLELTSAGLAYLQDVADALDTMAAATARVSALHNLTKISINMFPSFAVLWFMPQLSSWYQRSPHTDITVVTSMEGINFRSGTIDMAIHYDKKSTLSPTVVTLFDETIYPVCSPQYARDNGIEYPKSDLEGLTLIHCQSAADEWEQWFRETSASSIPPRRALNVDNRALALQAAESGLGVAMGRTPFAQRALRDGRLCRLFDSSLPSGFAYTIKLSDSAVRNPTIRDFSAWLVEIAKDCAD
jgi:LysR family glycine cleavage system transcriptional activator